MFLLETSAEPSLQAKQLQLKRARLADDLNDKISHRPGPMELIHKNILPVHSSIKQAIIGKPGQVSDDIPFVIYTPTGCLNDIWKASKTIQCFYNYFSPNEPFTE